MTETKLIPFSSDVKLDYQGRTIEGYAATFGNVDLVNDIIHPNAFAKTLVERGGKVKFLWQHDTKAPLGRVLEMNEDNNGLYFKAVISDTQQGRDALALLRDNAIEGMSIGYEPIVSDFSKYDGKTVRNLRELKLHEISLVTFPASPLAGVTALKDADPEPQAEAAPGESGEPEVKAGRIIAKRNAERVNAIKRLLQELIDDGGLETEDDEEAEAPAKAQAATDTPESKAEQAEAGPDAAIDAPPTYDVARLALEIELEKQRSLEV
ncbi:MAG: HK97 family phage prohead protease [Parcubacteria group bacterium]